jgi:hypothetical protein
MSGASPIMLESGKNALGQEAWDQDIRNASCGVIGDFSG